MLAMQSKRRFSIKNIILYSIITCDLSNKEKILFEVKNLSKIGVSMFCLSGLDFKNIANITSYIKNQIPDIFIVASCGFIDKDSLKYLKENSVDGYNFCDFLSMDFAFNILDIGLKLCVETKQKYQFLKKIRELNPFSVICQKCDIEQIILVREILRDVILISDFQKDILKYGIDAIIVDFDVDFLLKQDFKIRRLIKKRICD